MTPLCASAKLRRTAEHSVLAKCIAVACAPANSARPATVFARSLGQAVRARLCSSGLPQLRTSEALLQHRPIAEAYSAALRPLGSHTVASAFQPQAFASCKLPQPASEPRNPPASPLAAVCRLQLPARRRPDNSRPGNEGRGRQRPTSTREISAQLAT